MQNTDLTNYSSFLVWSGLECVYGCDHYGAVNNHLPVYQAIFGLVTNNRRNEQPGDLSASLLLTSEKAVFCNFINDIVTRGLVYVEVDCFY